MYCSFFFASVPLAVARRAVLSEAKKKKEMKPPPRTVPSACFRSLDFFPLFLIFFLSWSRRSASVFCGRSSFVSFLRILRALLSPPSDLGAPLLSQSSLIAAPPLGAAAGVAYSSCLPLSAGVAYSSRLRLPVAPPLRIAAGVLVLRVFLRPRADLLVLRLLAGFLLFRLPASVYLCVRLLALGMLSLLIFP